MNKIGKILYRFQKINSAILRFPLAIIFILATTITLAVMIHTDQSNFKLLFTIIIGGLSGSVAQVTFERFGKNIKFRFLCMGTGLLITAVYAFFVMNTLEWGLESGIKSVVAIMILIIAFIWLPVIQSYPNFNHSFLVAFKSFFQALLYTSVLFLGVVLIITAIDILIIPIYEKSYMYSADFIFVTLMPILILSMIPTYPGINDKKEELPDTEDPNSLNVICRCPKILQILVSYIMIPLAFLYTIILALYLVINIKSEFWSNNLLEPLLITYIIIILILYLLASTIENKTVVLFRKIFPKILIPIVTIQIISSFISVGNFGITHTKYFVIIFGIFSICASIVMSVMPIEKNGIIAFLFIAFSLITIVPPIDAFSISKISQKNILEKVLSSNDMLKDNTIIQNANLTDEDKSKIANSLRYMDSLNELNEIIWLPDEFSITNDFYDTFGFYEYESSQVANQILNLYTKLEEPLRVQGFDYLAQSYYSSDDVNIHEIATITNLNQNYVIQTILQKNGGGIEVLDENKIEIMKINTDELTEKYQNELFQNSEITYEEAINTKENEDLKVQLILKNFTAENRNDEVYYYFDFYLLIQLKE